MIQIHGLTVSLFTNTVGKVINLKARLRELMKDTRVMRSSDSRTEHDLGVTSGL